MPKLRPAKPPPFAVEEEEEEEGAVVVEGEGEDDRPLKVKPLNIDEPFPLLVAVAADEEGAVPLLGVRPLKDMPLNSAPPPPLLPPAEEGADDGVVDDDDAAAATVGDSVDVEDSVGARAAAAEDEDDEALPLDLEGPPRPERGSKAASSTRSSSSSDEVGLCVRVYVCVCMCVCVCVCVCLWGKEVFFQNNIKQNLNSKIFTYASKDEADGGCVRGMRFEQKQNPKMMVRIKFQNTCWVDGPPKLMPLKREPPDAAAGAGVAAVEGTEKEKKAMSKFFGEKRKEKEKELENIGSLDPRVMPEKRPPPPPPAAGV